MEHVFKAGRQAMAAIQRAKKPWFMRFEKLFQIGTVLCRFGFLGIESSHFRSKSE